MSHFSVNAVRPVSLYIVGVVVLCLFGWALSQQLVVSPLSFQFAYKREASFALFALGAVLGVLTILKNVSRSERPWSVTRAMVNRYFYLFLSVTAVAVLIAQ